MELRHLRYFIAVAEELHFTRAAERLHIGQPPLSQAIQALEGDVGALLLERSKRRVRLTEAGRLFLDDARQILLLAEQAGETARRAQRGETGELRIGYTDSMPLKPMFATVINRYRAAYPAVHLTLHEMPTLPQLKAIDERALDLGFVRPVDVPVPDTVVMSGLRDEPLVAVLPAALPLARCGTVALADLAELPFVMYPQSAGTAIYHQVTRLCREAGFVPRIEHEAREASTLIGLVAAGCGVSILPGAFERIHVDGVVYRRLAEPAARAAMLLARRAGERSALVDAFVQIATLAARE